MSTVLEQNKDDEERGKWKSKTEFILSSLGYAIGIGNVWRFPYLCYRNGGGAFLIPYVITLFLCGMPLYCLETSIGQFSSTGCITMFNISPLFKGVGYAIVIINIICLPYYSLILTYPLLFIKHSFAYILPWENCNNSWNTPNCITLTQINNLSDTVSKNDTVATSSDEFFHYEILNISSSINEFGSIVWPLFFGCIISWCVIYLCIVKGIKSVGKVVYFTATFPYLILFVLFIRGITLPGALEGIKFYIYPDWNKLMKINVWAEAATQIFYSLGPGWGSIVGMASYNKFNNNNLLDASIIPIINSCTSIFAGFVVFSVIGFIAEQTGLPISSVTTSGPSLAFITYPAAISMLPWANFWSILFFLMLFFLGIDTAFVQVETILTALTDVYPSLRKRKILITTLSCLLLFSISAIFTTSSGMYILQLFDWYSVSIPIIIICFLELCTISWIYGCEKFIKDIEFMNQKKMNKMWLVCWKYITPFILIVIFISTIVNNEELKYKDKPYPVWSIVLGWILCSIPLITIIWYMFYHVAFNRKGSIKKRLSDSIKPESTWCPSDRTIASKWLQMNIESMPLNK